MTNKPVRETEDGPIVYRGTERIAAGELQAMLRLVEAGRVAITDMTRFPAAPETALRKALRELGYILPPITGGG